MLKKVLFLPVLLFLSSPLFAYPSQERIAITPVTSQAVSMILDTDGIIALAFGGTIKRINTETWALATDQIPALTDNSKQTGGQDLRGDIGGLAIRGNFIFASQSDGDLLTIDRTKITANPTSLQIAASSSLGGVVPDPETGTDDDKLYILDKTKNAVLVYDISDKKVVTTITLTDALGSPVTPVALTFVPFPTQATSTTADKIYVTSNSGIVFVIQEGGQAIANRIQIGTGSAGGTGNKALPALGATPDGNFLLVVNQTDSTVHVISTASDTEVDTDPTTAGVNPISLPDNASLSGVVVSNVTTPTGVYAFVGGSRGLSVISLSYNGGTFQSATVLDFKADASPDTTKDPMTLSSIPGPILASSTTDGFVYTSNSNASISVISGNPYVTITGTSLGTSALTVGGSFTVSFKSDTTGSYVIRVGGDRTGTGTQVDSGTVGMTGTNVTSNSIAYNASTFTEGTNRVFVFVTDSSGNKGRSAVDITVNTPPPAVAIQSLGFGNTNVQVTFTRLTVSDMDHYNAYVDTDPAAVLTKTTVAGTASQPPSGDSVSAQISGLANGTTYYAAVEGVDTAGLVGTRSGTLPDGSRAAAVPQLTQGIVGVLGEGGCSLIRGLTAPEDEWAASLLRDSLPRGSGTQRLERARKAAEGGPLLGRPAAEGFPPASGVRVRPEAPESRGRMVARSSPERASLGRPEDRKERTPKWWSLELKGGAWLPQNATVKGFLGTAQPFGMAEFGFLWRSKLGVEFGAGFMDTNAPATGAVSGQASSDQFNFLIVPLANNVTFRFDFKDHQFLVPYVKAGPDYVIFREGDPGKTTKGVKYGLHGAAGLQILLNDIDSVSKNLEDDIGINEVYFVVEGRYGWVNSFGGKGLDLSNWTLSGGLLFEF